MIFRHSLTVLRSVIVASGLMSLVDDRIKERWPTKQPPSRRLSYGLGGLAYEGDGRLPHRSFLRGLMHRRNSEQQPSSPLRFGKPVTAY